MFKQLFTIGLFLCHASLINAQTQAIAQTWTSELEMLQALQPDVQNLNRLHSTQFKILGRGIQGKNSNTSIALACLHLNYPADLNVSLFDSIRTVDCNAFQIIYVKNSQAYQLSIPISSESDPADPLFLNKAAFRLFHAFLSAVEAKTMDRATEASFDQTGWSWSVAPLILTETEFLRVVHQLHVLFEPNQWQRRNSENVFLPMVNWRVWKDPQHLNLMTLFL